MPTARSALGTAVLDGKIYAIGGLVNEQAVLSVVEVYDPATDTWETKTPMATARCVMDCAVVEGKIYVIGGSATAGSSILSTLEVYDPATDTWETKTPLPAPRSDAAVEAVNGKIYVIGGSKRTSTYWAGLKTVEEYDPVTDTWSTKSEMPTARWSLGTCVIDGKIYTVGGNIQYPNIASAVEVYDPAMDTWDTSKAPMPTSRYSLSTCFFNGKIYAFGGWKASGGNSGDPMYKIVEEYDVITNTWTKRTDMPQNIALFSSESLNGKIYLIGGTSKQHTFNSLNTNYEYNPVFRAQFPEFTRIDTGTLVQEIVRGRGVYLVDIDQDGDLDLYIGNSTGVSHVNGTTGKNRPNLLYRNERNCRFTKISKGILAETIYETNPGSNWGDVDNDGDWDLFNHGELYLNEGYGNFEIAPDKISNRLEYGATWIDYNNDSFLDIFTNVFMAGNFMYKNNGDNTFSEVNIGAPSNDGIGKSQSCSWADCDNDGDLDFFEPNFLLFWNPAIAANNGLFINNGDNSFSPISSDSPIVSDELGASGGAWGDYDNDGDMDIYVFSVMQTPNYLYRNNGDLNFEQLIIEPDTTINKFTYSGTWGDFNNDGYLDLFVGIVTADKVLGKTCTFKENLFFINNGNGTFSRITSGNIITDGAQALAANDIDNDGDLDLVITHGNLAPPYLTYIYQNNGNNNNWLNIVCEGTYSNRSAIGTRVRVKANIGEDNVWMTREISQENGLHSCNGLKVHFGLGDAETIDSLIIRWPSGHIDFYLDVPANQFYHAIEDSVLEIDFKATNYIQLSPYFDDVVLSESGESRSIDLKDHYKLITGDTVPIFTGDTLEFTLQGNENQDAVYATLDGSILTLNTGSVKGKSVIQVIASAGFTSRMDQISVRNDICSSALTTPTNQSVLIYPNPVRDIIYVESGNNYSGIVKITNIVGQLVYSKKLDENQSDILQIDVSEFPDGIYVITFTNTKNTVCKKIIKSS
jgi:N-acetylneuraminic acid mutarotase